MRTVIIALALAGLCSAYSPLIVKPGSAPRCFLSGGRTIVQYDNAFHKSFHCAHNKKSCSCTLDHPSHQKGSCKQMTHTNKQLLSFGGDCSESGKNQCTCSNGTPVARGLACPKHGTNRCSSCNDGYYLSGTRCLKTPCACTNCNCYVGANNGFWFSSTTSWSRARFPRAPEMVEVTKTVQVATSANRCSNRLDLGTVAVLDIKPGKVVEIVS